MVGVVVSTVASRSARTSTIPRPWCKEEGGVAVADFIVAPSSAQTLTPPAPLWSKATEKGEVRVAGVTIAMFPPRFNITPATPRGKGSGTGREMRCARGGETVMGRERVRCSGQAHVATCRFTHRQWGEATRRETSAVQPANTPRSTLTAHTWHASLGMAMGAVPSYSISRAHQHGGRAPAASGHEERRRPAVAPMDPT